MKTVTKSVTTYFCASFTFIFHRLKAVFFAFYIVEGDKSPPYCHQNGFKSLDSFLKKPVFVVVTKMVTFSGQRLSWS